MEYATSNSKYKQRFGIYSCSLCGSESRKCQYDVKRSGSDLCFSCAMKKHGGSHKKLYSVWQNMKSRCYDKNHKAYKYYGGRGISIGEEFTEFEQYMKYVESLPNYGKDNYSIDRIDNDAGYIIGNLRWTSKSIQTRNTRRLYSNNTSGYRGVSFLKSIKRYRATIRVSNKRVYLGQYKKAIDAATAYNNYVVDNNLEHTINILKDKE